MRHLRFFLWVVPFFLATSALQDLGTPHVIWSYTYHEQRSNGPFANRYYTSCSYVGVNSYITLPARSGRCEWVHWAKQGDVQWPI